MLLKFAGVKKQYAVGMRWAVDDRSGIEAIQFNTNLHYGVMLNINEKISGKLRLVALADASHNKAICLAGLLASRYQNLILVHRMSDTVYWACIIKNNSVWSGVGVPKATAGDFVGSYTSVSEVIEVAKEEFSSEGIDVQASLLSTDTASEDFPDFKAIDFFSFVTKLKKERTYVVRYLQPSKILLQKLLALVALVIALGVGIYYVHQQRLVSRLLHQQQIEAERQRQLQIQAKIDYFAKIQKTIELKVGYAVVKNVLNVLNFIPLQSQGWDLTSANYDAQNAKILSLTLTRSDYGTLDSFLYAYSKTPINGSIGKDNNTGVKTLTFNDVTLEKGPGKIAESGLTQNIPRESYRLISYMQLNNEMFKFALKGKSKSQYGVNTAAFQVSGEKLWQLIQFEKALLSFPTLTINSINFVVNDYDMSWKVEGEIYA